MFNYYYENSLIYSKLDINLDITMSDINMELVVKPRFNNVTRAYFINNKDQIIQKINQKVNLIDLNPDIIYVMKLRNNNLGVHVDEFNASLNFYIDTDNEETRFYGIKDKSKSVVIPGNNNPRVDQSLYDEIGHFIAKDNEAYILNNRVLHSVFNKNILINKNRFLIKCAWKNLSAENLLKNIKMN